MIDPGRMNRRIAIQTAGALVPDGGGGWTPGTPTSLETDAYVEPLQGDEQLQAMQTGMVRPHRFTIRYRPDVVSTQAIIYSGRTFDVKSVVDTDEAHDELVILADEIVV
jgi:SPP1 family predicted phage head-tail adaptor